MNPVFNSESRILILGTIPSPKSRETGFYYNHPQNRFWKVTAAVLSQEAPRTNAEKLRFLLDSHIALWDVLASCEIAGAGDASIKKPVVNDIGKILCAAPIQAVFTTGAKATELYHRFCLEKTGIPPVPLPSTSAANAKYRLPELISAYRIIADYL